MRGTASLLALALLGAGCATQVPPPAAVVPGAAPGTRTAAEWHEAAEREVKEPAACVRPESVGNDHTPVWLFRVSRACLEKGDGDAAAAHFAMANVFGRFDTFRVADRSAHQAIPALRMAILGDVTEAQNDAFKAGMKPLADGTGKARLCEQLARIGPPAYPPEYMVLHGLGAVMAAMERKEQRDALVPGFDPAKGWQQAMAAYLHCGE